MSSSTPDRDVALLDIGHQCSLSSCLLHDFLPFKCQHCNEPFCSDHYLPDAHKCPKYDETKHNRIAPNCPLCNTPVAIPPGQDPNVRMERHFTSECSVMTGKTKASSGPHCAKAKCGKVLFAPIRCDTCRQQYCPQHRFAKDHDCVPPTSLKSSAARQATNVSSQTSAASAAAMAAIKRTMNNASAATRTATAPPPRPAAVKSSPAVKVASEATPSSSKKLPFSKSDRRAKSEKASRMKAMQARAKKGLLSEEEQAILAAEEAEAGKKKDDCVIA